jgi:hypothetical protein
MRNETETKRKEGEKENETKRNSGKQRKKPSEIVTNRNRKIK